MAYEDFDFGAEVAAAGGKVFKNPEPGPHDSIVSAIVHIGSFADVFINGAKKEPKPPVNFVLVQTTLMSETDRNDDGTRIQKWQAMPLKKGDKANLTKFLAAVDPAGKLSGFDAVPGIPVTTTWAANEKKGKNEDGTWKAVNLKGYTAMTDRTAKLVRSDAEEEGLVYIGHVRFPDITLDILEEIPGYLIRQYLLSESNGNNESYAGSAVEAIINAKRAEDHTWKTKQESDDEGDDEHGQPGHEQKQGSTANASSVPAPEDKAPPADLEEDKEF